jgi:hypothetical protein
MVGQEYFRSTLLRVLDMVKALRATHIGLCPVVGFRQ